MGISYLSGDLLAGDCKVIAHGCNAIGRFGRGIALAIREAMPEAYDAYMRAYQSPSGLGLGEIVWARSGDKLIANCIVQPTIGYRGTGQHIDYEALRSCMARLERVGRDGDASLGIPEGYDEVGLPAIGSMRGGGDWNVISSIIAAEFNVVTPRIHVLPGSGFVIPESRLPGL